MFLESLSVEERKKILLIVTGSVAAYKAIELTSLLVKAGHQVQVLLSHSALHFVGEAAFEAISGRPTLTNLWQSGDLLGHIHWIRWADLIVVAPATAEFIAQLAQGRAQDYPTTLSLAHRHDKPFFIFPAMNPSMWSHPATQDHVHLLRERGYLVITPDSGFMACREEGTGRLMDPLHIKEVLFSEAFKKTTPPFRRALVTSGGTRVPIDGVRHIGNFSSGQTGWLLTLELLRMGYQVDWLHARWSWGTPDSKIQLYEGLGLLRRFQFETPDDLDSQLKNLLEENSNSPHPYSLLWHLAAISDFNIELGQTPADDKDSPNLKPSLLAQDELSQRTPSLPQKKLDSNNTYWIKLMPRQKTLQWISSHLHPTTSLVAWKLTHHSTEGADLAQDKITKLFAHPHVRYAVHNDMSDYNRGERLFYIYSRESTGKSVTQASSIPELARKLEALCRQNRS